MNPSRSAGVIVASVALSLHQQRSQSRPQAKPREYPTRDVLHIRLVHVLVRFIDQVLAFGEGEGD